MVSPADVMLCQLSSDGLRIIASGSTLLQPTVLFKLSDTYIKISTWILILYLYQSWLQYGVM